MVATAGALITMQPLEKDLKRLKEIIDINGPWEFREFPDTARRMSDLEEGRWLAVSQPGSVILSLANAGILHLADVYADPEAFGWIGRQDWVFRCHFVMLEAHCKAQQVELVLEGLDTVTQIWVNEKLVGKTESMFVGHRFDIKPWIRSGQNTLTIKFCSTRQYAETLVNRYGTAGDPLRAYIRKAQYQFGSALGPELLDCGIIGPVRVECCGPADIDDIHIRTIDCSPGYADIRAAISIRDFRTNPKEALNCRLTIRKGDVEQIHNYTFDRRQNPLTTIFRIENPNLWQPKGYGQPSLYSIRVEIFENGLLLDCRETSFGIRTIRITQGQNPDRPEFGIEVNGRPIYIQGATWLPEAMFHKPDNQQRKRALLRQLSETHINMIRVWGGGNYEDEFFYQACDKLGILVWQDFMFASAYYPEGEWFTGQVVREAHAVVRRLRNHPCLAIWCGNSHIDQLHATGQLGKGKKFPGRALFHRLLPDILTELDPNRDYIPTSPNGEAEKNPAITDLWNIWNCDISIDAIFNESIPPFVIEAGFQSLPDIDTLRMVCPSELLTAGSAAIEKHNYHASGMKQIALFSAEYFAPPKTLDAQIYQSQVVQARGMKKVAETLRANNPYNRGLVLWSANDFWPGAGFSMIDCNGTRKALYYYARRFFAPILICKASTFRTGAAAPEQAIVIVNESERMLIAEVLMEQLDMKGRVIDRSSYPITVSPFSRTRPAAPAREFICPVCPEKTILRLAVVQDNDILCENIYLYQPDKYLEYRPLEIDIEIIRQNETTLQYTLQSRYFVKDLQLIPGEKASLSDNFFDMLPNRTYNITAVFDHPAAQNIPLTLRSACRQ